MNSQKKVLEAVVKNALVRAQAEIEISGDFFSEESLRYLVMDEISKEQIWGSFPNKEEGKLLLFEYTYSKYRRLPRNYFPDIVSLNIDEKGYPRETNPLAIELKISDWASKDIEKCRNYVDPKKGRITFDLAAVIIAPKPNKRNSAMYRTSERKRIQEQKGRIPNNELKILFAWINPEDEKPELFWIS